MHAKGHFLHRATGFPYIRATFLGLHFVAFLAAGCATKSEKLREYRENRATSTVIQRPPKELLGGTRSFFSQNKWKIASEKKESFETGDKFEVISEWMEPSVNLSENSKQGEGKIRYFVTLTQVGMKQTKLYLESEGQAGAGSVKKREPGLEWELFEKLDPAEASRIRTDAENFTK